jgi:hypothetical protein
MRTSALAAINRAEDLLARADDLPWYDPEARRLLRECLRAVHAARAEILRQAVSAAETFRESPRRDPARRGMTQD